jgi:hypothetical protein
LQQVAQVELVAVGDAVEVRDGVACRRAVVPGCQIRPKVSRPTANQVSLPRLDRNVVARPATDVIVAGVAGSVIAGSPMIVIAARAPWLTSQQASVETGRKNS